ncbi:MAG TPA: hypothetical protein VJ953_02040 [Saprospiraceae bacterium]|nr:hypothetical protein [Saprospiraceae bacterium]
MKYTYLLFHTLLIMLVFSACQQNQGEKQQPASNETSVPPMVDAKFVCTEISEDETMPRSILSLYLNGQVHSLDTISTCERIGQEDYQRYAIPSGAVTAAGGWWAGAGDYFYAMVDGNVCVVMQGWQDEQQEDDGFHYEQIRRFVVSEK